VFEFLIEVQKAVRAAISADINSYAQSGGIGLLLAMLPFGLVFGVAHAMTPGHSKTVLASYVLGSGFRPLQATMVAVALSATHITTAILLAMITNTLVTRTLVGAGRTPALEAISRYSLIVLGAWLIYRAIRQRPHLHSEGMGMGFVAGLVPCPLTLFVMMFAMSQNVPEAGLAFSLSMFLGVMLVLSSVALLTTFARQGLSRLLQNHERRLTISLRLLDSVAGFALIAVSVAELLR
jgi:nickel/cobalt transporter (NicO) family protein